MTEQEQAWLDRRLALIRRAEEARQSWLCAGDDHKGILAAEYLRIEKEIGMLHRAVKLPYTPMKITLGCQVSTLAPSAPAAPQTPAQPQQSMLLAS